MVSATDPVMDFIVLAMQAFQNRERVVDLQTLTGGLLGLPLGTDVAGRAGYQMSELERSNPVQFFFLNQLASIVRAHLPPQGGTGETATPAGPPPSQPPDTPPGAARRGRRAPSPGSGRVG
jgi:hypothetical protein